MGFFSKVRIFYNYGVSVSGKRVIPHTIDCNRQERHMYSSVEISNNLLNPGVIDLRYQPRINSFTGNIVKLKAIAFSRGYELFLPDYAGCFAPNDKNSAATIGNWSIRQVCTQIAQWKTLKQAVVPVAVGVYTQQLETGSFLWTVQHSLEKTRLPGNLLEVELQEKCIYLSSINLRKTLQSLWDIGVTISISGFGTDWSAFRYLRTLPIDSVMIHKCFVKGIGHDKKAEETIKRMTDILYEYNIRCFAPAVETSSQELFLASVGCQIIQSAHAPLPADRVTTILQNMPY